MPNWCGNLLTVWGRSYLVKQFGEDAAHEDYVFLIEQFLPVPPPLRERYPDVYQEGYDLFFRYGDSPARREFFTQDLQLTRTRRMLSAAMKISKEELPDDLDKLQELVKEYQPEIYEGALKCKQLREKYGASGWDEWGINNWGTKWDVNGTAVYTNERYPAPQYLQLAFEFESAWGPPLAAIETISGKYPTLDFRIEYAESGTGFEGSAHYKNGDTIDIHHGDYTGGILIRDSF